MSFLPQGHLVKLLISSFVVVFFLTACDDKIVSRHYVKTQNTIKIDSIRLISIYPDIQKRLEQSFKNEKLKIDADSIYSIKVDYMDYKKTC
ncbi:MAG: hypothetical protein U9P72_02865, partial [Campylobacterota bacterium]|nr:hypothetical protein [Campylobacterota bacterium]